MGVNKTPSTYRDKKIQVTKTLAQALNLDTGLTHSLYKVYYNPH